MFPGMDLEVLGGRILGMKQNNLIKIQIKFIQKFKVYRFSSSSAHPNPSLHVALKILWFHS